MQGKVKWFSSEKGYGFIIGDDGVERFFGVRDVDGTDLPSNGDIINFNHQDGNKGPRATNVQILARTAQRVTIRSDDRVTCTHCGKKMVPRIITDRGALSCSVCPYCGGMHKNFRSCFIASVVYGEDSPQVIALRFYRDNVLRQKKSGGYLLNFITIYHHQLLCI